MALDRDRDDVTDRTADDTRTQPAMGGKAGQRQAAHDDNHDDADDPIKAAVREATRKANHEAKQQRLRAKELEQQLAELQEAIADKEDAQLPEMEKLSKALTKREAELAETQEKADTYLSAYEALELQFAVFKAGATKVRPERIDAVLKLIDFDSIDSDEDGNLTGVDKAIDAVLKEYPEFAATGARAGTPPVPAQPGGTPPRRPVGAHGGGGNPIDRATDQLIQQGKYQRY